MSWFTDARDQAVKGLGLSTPQSAVKTVTAVVRGATAPGPAPGGGGNSFSDIAAVAAASATPAIGLGTLAAIGVLAYLIFRKRG